MYKRVLVPLDGSRLAEEALFYAKELALRLGSDVVLIHVAGKEEAKQLPLRKAYFKDVAEIIRRDIAETRKKDAGHLKVGDGVEVRDEVVVGYPADEILRFAATNDIDLILMATHGLSGISRWAMGSVADKVLHSSHVPVLLVRSGIPLDVVSSGWPTKILVPLDGSELAELALPFVRALAKGQDAEKVDVVLVRVCQPLVLPDIAGHHINRKEFEEKYNEDSRKSSAEYLAHIEKRFIDAGLSVRSEVLKGEPAEAIISYARNEGFNLVIMSTHGRSGLSRWVYGSVAHKVLFGGATPILLVRPTSRVT